MTGLAILGLLIACVGIVAWCNRRDPELRVPDSRERRRMLIEHERARWQL